MSDEIIPNKILGELLKNVPLLSKLSADERARLGGVIVEKKYKRGENIIVQGEEGDGFFIIDSGSVSVVRENEKTKQKTELAVLKKGDFFGEAALVNNAKRGATCSAIGVVKCFFLERMLFDKMFSKSRLNVRFAKRAAVSAESGANKKDDNHVYSANVPIDAIREKDKKTKDLILRAVESNVLFMNLTTDHKIRVIDEMYKSELKENTDIITQGDVGDNFYVVGKGEFHIFVNGKKVAARGKGTSFGELALMYNAPRAATVRAVTPAEVWVMDRFTFRKVVKDVSETRFKQYIDFLKEVPLLQPLQGYERQKIAEALEEVTFPANHIVFRQGDVGDVMYIVHTGELVVSKSTNGNPPQEVNKILPGGYFGERALIRNEPRAATLTTVGPCSVLKLDSASFQLLLGPLSDIMEEQLLEYEKDTIEYKTRKARQKADENLANGVEDNVDYSSLNLHDLNIIGTLGRGSFGHVQLVMDKEGNTYALKSVYKSQIVATGQQGHILSEKRTMARMRHPFLVRLYRTYKDADKLYFLLEPSLGGELFSILRERTLFDEDTARFYAACVTSAFDYMHEKNIIYRDLKPENLLLDEKGYIKITDFGFAKDISGGRTWTLCGTPDYLAPEIVSGKGHSKGVDWWTLGIFVYEMLASYPPFYDEDPMKTYAKIMHGTITFPSHFSRESMSLIRKLLQAKSVKRLGVVKGGAKLIRHHPWFKNFSWDDLHSRRMTAPVRVNIKSPTDLSNFDEYEDDEEEEIPEPYIDDNTGWDDDF